MRYYEILAEALNVELTAKRFGPQLRHRLRDDRSYRQIFNIPITMLMPSQEHPDIDFQTDVKIIQTLATYDPTPQKKYLINWIIPKYLSGGIALAEDLPGVAQDLEDFDRWKHKMPVKDIFQIKDASTLSKMVNEVLRAHGGLEGPNGVIPKEEIETAHKESIILLDNDRYTVVIPLSQRAAGFWGRRSQWCTTYGYRYGVNSRKTHCAFSQYDGPKTRLLIFFDKINEDGKGDIQCYYGSEADQAQIANVDDGSVSSKVLKPLFQMLPEDQIQIIRQNCLGDYSIEFTAKGDVTKKYDSVEKCIEECGNDVMRYTMPYIIGEKFFEMYDHTRSLKELWDAIPNTIMDQIEEYTKLKYPEEFDEDGDSDDSIQEILEYNDDELVGLLQNADSRAMERGAENDMNKQFTYALKSAGVQYEDFDGPCTLVLDVTLLDVLCDPECLLEEKNHVHLDEPRYGWQGYDDDTWNDDDDLITYLDEHLSLLKNPQEPEQQASLGI